jgi:two-component system, OmpR family, KDP operon response regulator KdpE
MRDTPRLGHVLLIEDDDTLATVVARHLRARGYDATIAPSAEEAVLQIEAGCRPTIVLLDINLPGDSGWAFLRGGSLAAVGSPPVYVVSATAVSSARLHEFGVAGYLPKPFAMPTLMEIVSRPSRATAAADGSAAASGDLDDL